MDKYTMISEFPVFTGKIEHAHTVYTRPSLSQREGSWDEASYKHACYVLFAAFRL